MKNIFFFLVPVLVCSALRQAAEIADGSRQCDGFYKKFTFYPDVFVVAVSYFDHKAFFHALLKRLLKLEEEADSSERLHVWFARRGDPPLTAAGDNTSIEVPFEADLR